VPTLRKRDVEALLATYDDDPFAALTAALRIVLDRPDADYRTLVTTGPFDDERRTRLLVGDVATLDALARELNETRHLGHRS
jgi:hypothetical protein